MLVESSTTESVSEMDTLLGNATNIQESIISMGITSTVQTVLMQCSTKIFKVKLYSFAFSVYLSSVYLISSVVDQGKLYTLRQNKGTLWFFKN